MEARNLRKERTGVVLSNKMDKTVTVAAKFKEKHPIYGKFVSKTKKYHAHDEKNECNIGDTVRIMETRHAIVRASVAIRTLTGRLLPRFGFNKMNLSAFRRRLLSVSE